MKSTGALIFAFNNPDIDYVALAAWSADNIRRHLNIPVALVTDTTNSSLLSKFDHVIEAVAESGGLRWFEDFDKSVPWHNASRMMCYTLSPWDETLVLDADYVVASNQLKVLLNSTEDFLAHRWACDVTGISDFNNYNYFGEYRMPMWWATVMMFRKTPRTKLIFDAMRMVRDNWRHYKNLYRDPSTVYRNDHALSIALNLVDGHVPSQPTIPWSLMSLEPKYSVKQITQDHYRVDYSVDGKNRWVQIQNQDFHVMGKKSLGDIVANNHR